MLPGLDGKVAIVTGGGTGIGRATAEALARSGASVLLVGRRPQVLSEAVDALHRHERQAVAAHACDLADPDAAEQATAAAVQHFGAVDLLCNNAAVDGAGTLLPELRDESWRHVLEVNVSAAFRLTRALAGHLRERGAGGAIVNVSSINGLIAERGFADYNTSKAALLALTRSAAVDLAGDGIRVNAVCPGYVLTEMTASYLERREVRSRIEGDIPLGRVGTAAEIASVVAFLLSDLACYVTGAAVVADGGRTAGFVGAVGAEA